MKEDMDRLKDVFLNELVDNIQEFIKDYMEQRKHDGLDVEPYRVTQIKGLLSMGSILGLYTRIMSLDDYEILDTALDKKIRTLEEQLYRGGYLDGFYEGYYDVFTYKKTKDEMDKHYDKILEWRNGDCTKTEGPPQITGATNG